MSSIWTRVIVAAALAYCAGGARAELPGPAGGGSTTAPAADKEKVAVKRQEYIFQGEKLITYPGGPLKITAAAPGDASIAIHNPFYAHPAWRLWFKDSSPIDISFDGKRSTLVVPPESVWNDCYMSLDGGHSGPLAHKPTGNYFDAPDYYDQKIMAPPELLAIFGVNFTSESLTLRGRYIVDDFEMNDRTERYFFFANCVRGSNAYISYNDSDPERVYDEFDALFGHSLQTIGHSGGPPFALKKMLDAGEAMPRKTKELLKTNGLYAPALVTLFRAALPITDVDGKPVPYESEMRHRPVYSMSGDSLTYADRWFKANVPYHLYDEKRHVAAMLTMAKAMEVPPPVAVMDLDAMTVTKGGATLVAKQQKDDRLKSVNKTIMRVWGNPGETIEVVVDLRKSIDLTNRPLTFHASVVYPNQKNIKIEPGPQEGMFRVTAQHDLKLPKGRLPVVFFVRNGAELPSNPVFLNFYWPSSGETQSHYPAWPANYKSEIPEGLRINDNRRPVVTFEPEPDASGVIACEPGVRVSFRVHATDPEGYSTTIYRWPGEIGQLKGDEFTCEIPATDYLPSYPVHLIFSDGTGGFTGKLIKLMPKLAK